MGSGIIIKCEKCKYEIVGNVGVGFNFPSFYQELVEKMKNGEYGEELKLFFENNKDASINGEIELYQCTKCNKYFSEANLDAYHFVVPKRESPWTANSQDDGEYVIPYELKNLKPEIKRKHTCPECEAKMKKVTESSLTKKLYNNELFCPCCGEPFSAQDFKKFCWD